jgi:hypothetical protein
MPLASRRRGRSTAIAFGVLAAYAALAVAFTWPLAAQLSSVVPYDLTDPLSFIWILWWNAHATPLTGTWLNAPIFYPSTGTIVYQDALLGVWPLTTPLQWLGVTPVAVHNLLVIASFALSACAAYVLCRRLFHDRGAAFVGGLIYGFAVYRVAQIVHLNILLTHWVPLILVGLHEYLTTRRRAWLMLAAGAWIAQGMTSGYFLIYSAMLVGLWGIYFLRFDGRRWLEIIGAFGASLLATWPWWALYRSVHAAYGFERSIGEADWHGADVMSITDAPPFLTLWGSRLAGGGSENQFFPGFALATVCVLVIGSSNYWHAPRWSRTSTMLMSVATVFCALAAVAAWAPTTFAIAGVRVSLTTAYKPLAWAWLSMIVGVGCTPPVLRVLRDRGVPGFYALAAAVLWIFSLGPTARFMGRRIWYKAPYSWLYVVPGAGSVRVPARLWMIVVLALSVLAAYGLTKLRRRSRSTGLLAIVVLGAAVLIEAWPGRLPLNPLPERFLEIERSGADDLLPLLELPLEPHRENQAAMYRSIFHGRPLINGASGYYPASFGYLTVAMRVGDAGAFIPFAERMSFDILVRKQASQAVRVMNVVDQIDSEVIADTEALRIYRIHRRPAIDEPPPAEGATISRIVLGGEREVTRELADPTRLANAEAQDLDVSLATPCTVDEVQLNVSPGVSRVTVRALRPVATELWSGGIAERGVRAAFSDPRHPRLRLRFATTRVDNLAIELQRAPGEDPVPYIRSVAVFGPGCGARLHG